MRQSSNFPVRMHPLMWGVRAIGRLLIRLRMVWIILVATLFLSGCVQYDVGIKFADASHGQIVQHIRLSEPLSGFSYSVLSTWLERLEQQTKQLGGRIQHPSDCELIMTIPFHGGKDLATKFNQLFPSSSKPELARTFGSNPPESGSRLQVTTRNFILWQRNHLNYDLDLRSLAFPSPSETLPDQSDKRLELAFSLDTPWGAQINDSADTATPEIQSRGRQLIWQLKPGTINHLEAVFWVPNPLGIGTFVIVLLIVGGMYLERRRSTSQPENSGNG
ncbi:MAG: DUF3153 domain-containing protein [Cyanobacteria bacterium CRU_2_1]|nr:DUF3153 domain-containing protein [Cyanobacteria bacterium RU_5_0]NJR61781.1 DUF3153 domain-containing protein [Cyanobacteria bacterium CRU_2_1]